MKRNIEFKCADAWLLLSIIYANKNGSTALSDIIAYGDYINHAIFTTEELEGGLFRLISSGYIIEDGDGYRATDKIMEPYKKLSTIGNKSIYKNLVLIREKIASPAWSDAYDPMKANEGIVYKRINKEIVKSAYKEYLEKIGVKK